MTLFSVSCLNPLSTIHTPPHSLQDPAQPGLGLPPQWPFMTQPFVTFWATLAFALLLDH